MSKTESFMDANYKEKVSTGEKHCIWLFGYLLPG